MLSLLINQINKFKIMDLDYPLKYLKVRKLKIKKETKVKK